MADSLEGDDTGLWPDNNQTSHTGDPNTRLLGGVTWDSDVTSMAPSADDAANHVATGPSQRPPAPATSLTPKRRLGGLPFAVISVVVVTTAATAGLLWHLGKPSPPAVARPTPAIAEPTPPSFDTPVGDTEVSETGVFGGGGAGELAFRSVAIGPDGDVYAVGDTSVPSGDFAATHGGRDALYVHLRING